MPTATIAAIPDDKKIAVPEEKIIVYIQQQPLSVANKELIIEKDSKKDQTKAVLVIPQPEKLISKQQTTINNLNGNNSVVKEVEENKNSKRKGKKKKFLMLT